VKNVDVPVEKSRPSSATKFDFDTICAGVMFMIKNPMYIEKLHRYLDSNLFFVGDESLPARGLRQIVRLIHEVRKNSGTTTITEEFFHTSLRQLMDSDEADEARRLYDNMRTRADLINKSNDRGCQNVFLDFLRVIQIVKWSHEFTPQYKSGLIAGAVKSIKDLTGELDMVKFEDISEAVDLAKMSREEVAGLLSMPSEKRGELFLLGCPSLDDAVGGFERRALHLFIAATNGGKSMMTHHLISQSIRQGLTVHITIVEDRPKSFFRRLFANVTGIEINRLKYNWNDLTSEELKKVEDARELIARNVKIDFGYGESVDAIHRKKLEYDAERVARGQKPYDVDIVDYTGHIADKSSGEKTYEKFRNAFAERKNYCLINNKIGFDFAQVNRAGFQKKQNDMALTHGELAGSYDLSQVCDNIISINRFPSDIAANTATLLISKVKDGITNQEGHKVGTDFARARWIMDVEPIESSQTIQFAESRAL
jgi:KaiC/GvpD/RAD55 family RecA-like ATPase